MFHAIVTGTLAGTRLYPFLHILRSRQRYPLMDSPVRELLHAMLAREECVKDFYRGVDFVDGLTDR
ncbi:hypothetical protein M3J09_002329 [Ascochyta lentis]